jgi:AbrB family looped-hinge helix DNA binding protein
MLQQETTLTRKGQVTIPLAIRRHLGLKPRDRMIFELDEDGIRLRPAGSRLLAGFGAVSPTRRPEDFAAHREEFEREVAEEASSES